MLINYANELLVSMFVNDIIIREKELYETEGLYLTGFKEESNDSIGRVYFERLRLFEGNGQEKVQGILV